MSKRIRLSIGASKKMDKPPTVSSQPILEEDLFQDPFGYQNYLQMIPCKVEPNKCMHDKLLVTTHLPPLLEKYKFTKFLYFKSTVYPRLVRMFYANLEAVDDKVSCYVMHKYIVIDSNVLGREFEMHPSPPKLQAKDFPYYT